MYRGILPQLLQRPVNTAIVFGMYTEYNRLLSKYAPDSPPELNKLGSAGLTGFTKALLTPFERVQGLMQNDKFHNQFKNTFHAFKVLQPYGIGEYYRGFSPILLRNTNLNLAFFGLREPVNSLLPIAESAFGKVFSGLFMWLCYRYFLWALSTTL